MSFWQDLAVGGSAYAATLRGQKKGEAESKKNRAAQREAMQKGIQWKVRDAELAGIHPVFALGASTNMPAPIQTDFGGYERAARGLQDTASGMFDRASQMRAQGQAEALMNAQMEESRSRTALNLVEASEAFRATQSQRGADMRHGPDQMEFGDSKWKTSHSPTAQTVQDEYGDFIEWLYGAARLVYDGGQNLGRSSFASSQRKAAQRAGERQRQRRGMERVR